jgi:flagellar basal body-associated protein FliL
MVDTTSLAGALGEQLINWVFLGLQILIIAVAGGFIYWFGFKKVNYKTKVLVADTTTSPETYYFDRGAIVKDGKTNRNLFRLLKSGVGLDPDGMTKRLLPRGIMTFVGKYGFKNFAFINPSVSNPGMDMICSHADVTHAINQYDRSKKMYGNNLLMQILPYAGLAFLVLGFILMMYFVTKKFDVLADVASSLKEAAYAMREVNAGTIIR